MVLESDILYFYNDCNGIVSFISHYNLWSKLLVFVSLKSAYKHQRSTSNIEDLMIKKFKSWVYPNYDHVQI
ncbi:hypothetical protein ABKN59_001749 [Abortiporus biennis]